jgi:hypothetical protein
MLRVTRELYNALLQQRRDRWTSRRESVTAKAQYAEITELRAADRRFAAVYRECEDAVLHRLNLAAGGAKVKRDAGYSSPGSAGVFQEHQPADGRVAISAGYRRRGTGEARGGLRQRSRSAGHGGQEVWRSDHD